MDRHRANQPMDADALTRVFDHGQLGTLAQSPGLSPQDATGGLARVLPHVVDHLTPAARCRTTRGHDRAEALARLQHRPA